MGGLGMILGEMSVPPPINHCKHTCGLVALNSTVPLLFGYITEPTKTKQSY